MAFNIYKTYFMILTYTKYVCEYLMIILFDDVLLFNLFKLIKFL